MSRRNVLDALIPKAGSKKETEADATKGASCPKKEPSPTRGSGPDGEDAPDGKEPRDVSEVPTSKEPSAKSAKVSGASARHAPQELSGESDVPATKEPPSSSTKGLEASNPPAAKEVLIADGAAAAKGQAPESAPGLEASNHSSRKKQSVETTARPGEGGEPTILKEPQESDRSHPPAAKNRSGALKSMDRFMGMYVPGDAQGEFVVSEIETELIDRSFVGDRIEDPNDYSISDLVESIRENGQQVPILVRVHPDEPGRYQTAYGHRRVAAAKILGRPARAVVRAMTDAELVVAQGQENLERRDLSYIERAFFAMRLKEREFSHPVIAAAMGVYKSDVSSFIKVAREVPEGVIRAIGPAPKAGGPRWRLLAERLRPAPAEKRAAEIIKDAGFSKKSTDERFVTILEALAPSKDAPTRTQEVFKDLVGRRVGRFDETDNRFTVSIDRRVEPDFGAYLRDRLPDLLAAFRRDRESPDLQPEQKGDEATE